MSSQPILGKYANGSSSVGLGKKWKSAKNWGPT